MDDRQKESLQYRFSGYQLPMIQLDATGPQYVQLGVHPYYINQPEYWQTPYYYGHPGGFGNASNANKLFPFNQNDENT